MASRVATATSGERPTFQFTSAVGARSYAAHPECGCVTQDVACDDPAHAAGKGAHPALPVIDFTSKVKVATGAPRKGGCS
jgi:hypothetical protein